MVNKCYQVYIESAHGSIYNSEIIEDCEDEVEAVLKFIDEICLSPMYINRMAFVGGKWIEYFNDSYFIHDEEMKIVNACGEVKSVPTDSTLFLY